MLAGSSARPRSRPLRLLECRVIPSLLSSSLCPLVTHWLLVLFHEMVPYIDDSHVRRWKKLPRNRHIRSMSYHPSLRSNLSILQGSPRSTTTASTPVSSNPSVGSLL